MSIYIVLVFSKSLTFFSPSFLSQFLSTPIPSPVYYTLHYTLPEFWLCLGLVDPSLGSLRRIIDTLRPNQQVEEKRR